MRLCRFRFDADDETPLAAFYADDHLVPVDQAAEAFAADHDRELDLGPTSDLLALLPPDGEGFVAARALETWLAGLEADRRAELAVPIADVELLTPIERPGKILALAGNYAAHVAERGGTAAERSETFPYVFIKPITTLNHPGAPILLPRVSPGAIDWECELAVVIGAACKHVDEADALHYVAGYTVANDISDRKFTPNPGRKPRDRDKHFDWLHGKWHDGSCPVGPCLLSSHSVPDPQILHLRLTLNGQVKQDAPASQMVFPVAAVVAFASSFMTLEPGDLILTGTPSGVGSATGTFLKAGDRVEATVEEIGTLRNMVEAE